MTEKLLPDPVESMMVPLMHFVQTVALLHSWQFGIRVLQSTHN